MTTYFGSCLCKNISFEITGELKGFFLCHCSRCRKVTGSAHAANLFSNSGVLTWVSGEEHIRTFHLPDTRFEKSFCTLCGSALPTVGSNGRLLIPAGSLDSHVDLKPDAHIFVGSRANWDHELETVAKFEGLPT